MVDQSILPETDDGHFVGRVFRPDIAGPSLVTIRGGRGIDITSKRPLRFRFWMRPRARISAVFKRSRQRRSSRRAKGTRSIFWPLAICNR